MPCIRFKAIPTNLPDFRVKPSRLFSQTGIDYAGPFYLKTETGRGYSTYKGCISVFICLSTRAIYLEVVSDYTTNAFIAAFRQFTSTRGPCHDLYCDNGTNSVGADAELRSLYELSSEHCLELQSRLIEEGTNFHFNPPAAPHFGGIWEAAVKSTKHHLRRVIGETKLTFEEL